jgi:hypothetical protein
VGSVLFLDELRDDPNIACDLGVGRFVDQVANLGRVELPVAVDSPIALLQGD